MFYFTKSGPLYEWGAGINVLVAGSTGWPLSEEALVAPYQTQLVPVSWSRSVLKDCTHGERGHVGVEEGHRVPALSLCPSLCCSGKNWKGRNDGGHYVGKEEGKVLFCCLSLLLVTWIYIYIYIWQYIKIFFPKLSLLSFMPATVTGKQSPSLYLSPWAFSFYFHPVSHWGGKVNEQVGGHLVVSQG